MKTVKICVLFIVSIFVFASVCYAGNQKKFSTLPCTNNGQKWKIGYYQGGDYINYQSYLASTVKGLMDMGWIEEISIPKVSGNTKLFWEWLCSKAKSDYIQFVEDAYYSSCWDQSSRKKISQQLITRLAKGKDIDLMIAMGTWAGKDLSNDMHHVNTLIMSTSDPVESGIIQSNEDSGHDHIHARTDPLRYERQIMLFHDMVKFKTIGVAYEDTVAGRSYAAVDAVEKVAARREFKIARCFTQSDIADQNVMNESVIQCFKKLVLQADAIYVTVQGGVNAKTIPTLVDLAQENRIPTFSQFGSTEVKQGFLMSMSRKKRIQFSRKVFCRLNRTNF